MKASLGSPTAASTEDGLRPKLISVALDILERDGIEALTLRAVARGAGVSHGAPARHFDSLDDLKAEVAATAFKIVADEIEKAVSTKSHGNDPKEPLVTAAHAYVNFALNNPGLFSLIIRTGSLGLSSEAMRRERRSATNRFLWLVEKAQARGWNPNMDSNLIATSLWASIHGIASLWMHGAYQQAHPEATLEKAIAVVFELS